jgi:3'-phosphoadenosine 5'-phosphosulfate sulfotransferase (PAPS reductase)/FAD synthetase
MLKLVICTLDVRCRLNADETFADEGAVSCSVSKDETALAYAILDAGREHEVDGSHRIEAEIGKAMFAVGCDQI